MLYTSTDDFYKQISNLKRLSREQEKDLAQKMKLGDEGAKKALMDGYLPVLGAYLKRYTHTPSLDMIYKGIEILKTSIETFDFLHDSPSPNSTFANYLADKVRRMITRYIADENMQ